MLPKRFMRASMHGFSFPCRDESEKKIDKNRFKTVSRPKLARRWMSHHMCTARTTSFEVSPGTRIGLEQPALGGVLHPRLGRTAKRGYAAGRRRGERQ